MLYDNLENISRYRGLFKGLDILIDWLQDHHFESLPLGRTEISGDRVFINVMTAATRPVEGAEYEVHGKYMDLQLNLEGEEVFQLHRGTFTWTEPINLDEDIGFGTGCVGCSGHLGDGMFALFLAGEPHMPTLRTTTPEVKKVVVKILCDELF